MSEFNANKIEIPSESLPFIDEADVIVVGGGGTLGLIAVTAKNNGKETYRSRRHSSRLIIIAFNA